MELEVAHVGETLPRGPLLSYARRGPPRVVRFELQGLGFGLVLAHSSRYSRDEWGTAAGCHGAQLPAVMGHRYYSALRASVGFTEAARRAGK
jgi:hypothetical protein